MRLRKTARRDANDAALAALARKLGVKLWALDTPCDYLGLWAGKLWAIEIKLPEGPKGGTKDRNLTTDQALFRLELNAQGLELHIWRTEEDVLRFVSLRNVA
jgi:hypothetical protein